MPLQGKNHQQIRWNRYYFSPLQTKFGKTRLFIDPPQTLSSISECRYMIYVYNV